MHYNVFTYGISKSKQNKIYFYLLFIYYFSHRLSDVAVKPYEVYKPVLVFLALVNKLHELLKVRLFPWNRRTTYKKLRQIRVSDRYTFLKMYIVHLTLEFTLLSIISSVDN